MSEKMMDVERAAFEAWVVREWPTAPLHHVRDALPKTDPRYGEYCGESLQRAWVGWQARASQPVGVPFEVRDFARRAAAEMEKHDFHGFEPVVLAVVEQILAAPTVKAEQVQCATPTGNACPGDGVGACKACPSPPAAGSAVEEVEVAAFLMESDLYEPYVSLSRDSRCDHVEPLMTVAQHNRIVAALSAQQSAPERVSVRTEALRYVLYPEQATLSQWSGSHQELCALLSGAREGGV